MITKIFSLLSSLVVGAAMLFSFNSGEVGSGPQQTPQPPTPGSQTQKLSKPTLARLIMQRKKPGDQLLRLALVKAAVQATGMGRAEVVQALRDGKSVADIAQAAGKTEANVLAVFDAGFQKLLNQMAQRGKLPAGMVATWSTYYHEAAQLTLRQPGLSPVYPGPGSLRTAAVMAAANVAGLQRDEVREGLGACQSLDQILKAKGHTSQEAVDLAMEKLGKLLDKAVENGKMTQPTAAAWKTSLRANLEKMMTLPGLNLAGKTCAQ